MLFRSGGILSIAHLTYICISSLSSRLRYRSHSMQMKTPKNGSKNITHSKVKPDDYLAVINHRRLPGTKMKRQHRATVTTKNMSRTVRERLASVFFTNGSLILLKSKKVYSL